jgi:hypothetical protein
MTWSGVASGVLLASIALTTAVPALADPTPGSPPSASASDPANGPFGNTVVVTNADGSSERFYIEPDGTYTARRSDGAMLNGRWTESGPENDGIACFVENSPTLPPDQQRTCFLHSHRRNVGDSFDAVDQAGHKIHVSIVAGRELTGVETVDGSAR